MLRSRKLVSYNDGVVDIYKEATAPSSFGAKVNATRLDDMDPICHLDYRSRVCRDEDYAAAERLGFVLSRKIEVHERPEVRPGHKAVIDHILYDIGDIDRDRRSMYLFLGGGEEL